MEPEKTLDNRWQIFAFGVPAFLFGSACLVPFLLGLSPSLFGYFLTTMGLSVTCLLGMLLAFWKYGTLPKSTSSLLFATLFPLLGGSVTLLMATNNPNLELVIIPSSSIVIIAWTFREKFEWKSDPKSKRSILLLSLIPPVVVGICKWSAIYLFGMGELSLGYLSNLGAATTMGISGLVLTLTVIGSIPKSVFTFEEDQKPQIDPDGLLPPRKEALRLVKEFSWAKPKESLSVVKRLANYPEPSILVLLLRMRIHFFKMPTPPSIPFRQDQLQLLAEIDAQIKERVRKNTAVGSVPKLSYCPKCRIRAKRFSMQQISITCCPKCHQDRQLVPNTKLIIGTMEATAAQATPEGLFMQNAWDIQTRALDPDLIDGYRIPAGDHPQVDHYLAAVLAQTDNLRQKKNAPFRLYIENHASLSENSQRQIASALAKGTIQVFDCPVNSN